MAGRNDEYLINTRPGRALFLFSLPIMIGNLFQQTYTVVDSLVVGRFVGEAALAAIGACYAFTSIFIWAAFGGGIGASVVVSRLFGERDYRRMASAVSTALIMFFIISLGLTVTGLVISRPVMTLLRTPAESLEPAIVYLRIYFLGLPFLFLYNIVSSMFNALGNSRITLYFLIFSSLLNIVLDVLFVRNLHMVIGGVAWATLIAQGLASVTSLALLLRTTNAYLRRTKAGLAGTSDEPANNDMRSDPVERPRLYDRKLAASMWSIAWPSILQQCTVSIGMMLVQSVVNTFGAAALAGYSAGSRVEDYCCAPWSAFNAAISTYTAQNIGAGEMARVRRGFRSISLMILACSIGIFLVLEPAAPLIMKAFLGDNISATASSVGIAYIRWDGIFIGLLGFKMSVDGTLRGAADTRAFTIANLVNLAIRVTMAFTLAPVFGIMMVWVASPVGWLANALISGLHLRKLPFMRKQGKAE